MTNAHPTGRQDLGAEVNAAIKRLARDSEIATSLLAIIARNGIGSTGEHAAASLIRARARKTEQDIANYLNVNVADIFAHTDGAIQRGFGFLEPTTSSTTDAETALRLFLLTPRTRAFLLATDPKGVVQAEAAVEFTDDERDAVESERDFEKWTAAYRRG